MRVRCNQAMFGVSTVITSAIILHYLSQTRRPSVSIYACLPYFAEYTVDVIYHNPAEYLEAYDDHESEEYKDLEQTLCSEVGSAITILEVTSVAASHKFVGPRATLRYHRLTALI